MSDKQEQGVRVFALDAFRAARALELSGAEARRVAEVQRGERYTADVMHRRLALELSRQVIGGVTHGRDGG